MGKIAIVFLIASILILISILAFLGFGLSKITGETVKNHYTYTKAICDETKYCEDYEITCQDGETVSINPTGAAIQFSDTWQDPRDKGIIEKIC